MQLQIAAATWRIETRSDSVFLQITSDVFCAMARSWGSTCRRGLTVGRGCRSTAVIVTASVCRRCTVTARFTPIVPYCSSFETNCCTYVVVQSFTRLTLQLRVKQKHFLNCSANVLRSVVRVRLCCTWDVHNLNKTFAKLFLFHVTCAS